MTIRKLCVFRVGQKNGEPTVAVTPIFCFLYLFSVPLPTPLLLPHKPHANQLSFIQQHFLLSHTAQTHILKLMCLNYLPGLCRHLLCDPYSNKSVDKADKGDQR